VLDAHSKSLFLPFSHRCVSLSFAKLVKLNNTHMLV